MAELTIVQAQSGQHFSVEVGDSIAVSLRENASTGYKWSIVELDRRVLDAGERRYQPEGGAVGSAGTAVWTFTARGFGRTRVALRYSRPWQKDASAVERFHIDLDIRDPKA